MEEFKNRDFDVRVAESKRLHGNFPDRRCVIVDRAISEKKLDKPNKVKYIVPKALTIGQFAYVIRKRIVLKPEEALFLFVNENVLPATAATIEQIYNEYRLDDGFLYMTFASENTFG